MKNKTIIIIALILILTMLPTNTYAAQPKTQIISVKNIEDSFDDGGRVVIKWKKVKTAKYYKIQYTTDKNFKKNVKIIKVKPNKFKQTIKGLKYTKTYYFKIKASNKKYSKKQSVKVIGYFCNEGGKHHSVKIGQIGWVDSYDEAVDKSLKYISDHDTSGHFLPEECYWCGKFTAEIRLN